MTEKNYLSYSMKRVRIVPSDALDWWRGLDCSQSRSPDIKHGARYCQGWWKCPNGCNKDALNIVEGGEPIAGEPGTSEMLFPPRPGQAPRMG